MAYSDSLAQRVRAVIAGERSVTDKKMFGGIAFLLRGNMCLGIWRDFLIVRVGQDGHAAALARPGARPFDVTGRPMAGWVMVEADALDAASDLRGWVELGLRFARSLPAKPAARSPARRQAKPKPAARGKKKSARKSL